MKRAQVLGALWLSVALASCSERPDVTGVVGGKIDGQVLVTAPVAGVVVSAYQLDLDTGRPGQLLGASAPTDNAGHYHIEVGTAQGPILLVAKGVGGTYVEPSSGVTAHWDSATELRGVYVAWTPEQDLTFQFTLGASVYIVLSPVSEWAVASAPSRLASRRDTSYADALKSAVERWRDHLELDWWSVTPQDLTQGPVGAWNTPIQAGVFYSALSQLTLTMAQQSSISPAGLSSLLLVNAIRDDLSDSVAQLDGHGPGGQLTIGTCAGLCRLSELTLRARLAEAGAGFLGASANKSGITVTDAQQYLTRVSTRAGDLWPNMTPGGFDTTPPGITIDGLQDAAILHDTVTAKVTVFDTVEMGTATIAFSRAGMPVTGFYTATTSTPNAQTVVVDLSLATKSTTDGPIVMTVQATDKAGNAAATVTLSLFIDNLGPGALSGIVLVGGRVQGARVQAWEFDGGVKGAKLGEGVTDDAGVYSVQVATGTTSGSILLEASNPATGPSAQYVEPVNGYRVVFSSDDVVSSIVTGWHNGAKRSDGMLTPWTTLGTSLAHGLFVSPLYNSDGTKWMTAVEDGFTLLEDHFAVGGTRISLRAVQPADLTAPGVTTFTTQARYGYILCTLSELADHEAVASNTTAASLNTLTLTKLLAQDLAQDGVGVQPLFNGRTGAGQLVSGRVSLTSYTTRVDFSTAAVDFLTNPNNKAPFVELDIDPLLDRMASDGGRLYPVTAPPIPYDKLPPSPVVFVTPTPSDGTVLRGVVPLQATAMDNRALATFAWEATSSVSLSAISGSLLDKGASLAGPWTLTGSLNTDGLTEGTITVSAIAIDEALNATHTSPRTLVVDRTKPVIAIASAVAGTTAVGNGGWTGSSSVTLHGTITELHLASATYTWAGGAAQPLTVAAGGSWNLTLAMPATGAYGLVLNATDAAGNAADAVSFNINRDATPPSIVVRASIGYDDSTMAPTVVDDPSSAAGAVSYATGEFQFSLISGASFAKFPQFYQVSSPKLPEWHFDVEDNHTTAASLELWARLSRSGAGVLVTWFKVGSGSGTDWNRLQVLSAALHPDIAVVSDTYTLEYYAKDEFANQSTTGSVTWTQTILPPPVRQRADGTDCDCTSDPTCVWSYTLASTNACNGFPGYNASHILKAASSIPIAYGFIDNPNDVPVRVKLAPMVSATFSRGTLWMNVSAGSVTPEVGPCGQWQYALDGTCPYTPVGNSASEIVEQNLTAPGNLYASSSATASALGGNAYWIGPHTSARVVLYSAGWSWVLAEGPIADYATVGTITNTTGAETAHWRRCTAWTPDHSTCTVMPEYLPYHYFTRLSVWPVATVSLYAQPDIDSASWSTALGTNVSGASYSTPTWCDSEDHIKYPLF